MTATATRTTGAQGAGAGHHRQESRRRAPRLLRDLGNLTDRIAKWFAEREEELERDGGQVVNQVLRGDPLDDDPLRDPARDPLGKGRAAIADKTRDPDLLAAYDLLRSFARRQGIVWD